MNKIFIAQFVTWDGNDIISVHKTRDGANSSIENDKKEKLDEHNKLWNKEEQEELGMTFDSLGYFWNVLEMEIKD